EPGRKPEILVRGPGKTIGASMLTTSIGVQTVGERDVRAVVAGEDGAGGIAEELRFRGGGVAGLGLRQWDAGERREAVRRVIRGPAPVNGALWICEHVISISRRDRCCHVRSCRIVWLGASDPGRQFSTVTSVSAVMTCRAELLVGT